MPDAAQGWYEHIAHATEELREELREMQAANATPQQFGLKVRSDPDTLIVTARNKMGTGQNLRVSVGLSKTFIETAILRNDEDSLAANRTLAGMLATQLASLGKPLSGAEWVRGAGWLVRGVPPGPVEDFVSGFRNSPNSIKTQPGPVRLYIEQRRELELAEWDVLFAGLEKADQNGLVSGLPGVAVNCQRRARGKPVDDNDRRTTLRITSKQRVASRGVEKTGVDPDRAAKAEEAWRNEHGTTNFPDRIYRKARTKPLLIVHLLGIGEKGDDLTTAAPVVAWSISFPESELEQQTVEYVVNTTWWKENYRDDTEDDDHANDKE